MPLIERVLRRRIASKLAQLEAYRPLPAETARKLEELVTVSMTYNSNAIEGSTMQLAEVDLALAGYPIPGGHTAEEIAETVGHAKAWQRVEEDIAAGNPMRAEFIIELHGLVKPYHPQRGGWREQQVYIRGAQHLPPHAREIPRYMQEWIAYANKEGGDPIERAAIAHAGFEAVHPFLDGNGRVGRLLLNWMLLKAGYPPAIIQVEERARYITALVAATPPDPLNYAPIAQLVAERVDTSLTLYLTALIPDDRYPEFGLEEASRRSGLTSRRLRTLAAEGKLEAKRYGKRWVTWQAALDAYLQSRNPIGRPRTQAQEQ
jgi:hypothetical protein